ncbi:MAG: hypothetical protein WCK67_06685 [bacterium]
MGYTPTNPIDSASMMLDLISRKQEAIGANITNVNTPNYERQDINFSQYLGTLNSPLETKLSKKMGPCPVATNSGEKVRISEELIAMQKNALFYSVASRRVSTLISQYKTIAQVGR